MQGQCAPVNGVKVHLSKQAPVSFLGNSAAQLALIDKTTHTDPQIKTKAKELQSRRRG